MCGVDGLFNNKHFTSVTNMDCNVLNDIPAVILLKYY